jgi:hypothetical protein
MSIPLVRNNTKDAINTSIIAIKKNLERINTLLGLVDSSEPDLSGLATKQELEDTVTEINNTIDEVETSLQPVDTVTSGNMHSVTSNAVAEKVSYSTTEQLTGGKWIDGKPIYRKVIDFGALPNANTKNVAHNITNIGDIVNVSIIAKSSTEYLLLATGKNSVTDFNAWITKTNINIHTDSNRSSYNAITILEYTKTTDQARHLMTTREFIEPMIKEILEEDK